MPKAQMTGRFAWDPSDTPASANRLVVSRVIRDVAEYPNAPSAKGQGQKKKSAE